MEIDFNFSKICIQCGMCCDGTLFTKTKVTDSEDELLVKSLGLKTYLTSENKIFFEQPCSLFNKVCTVYNSRPNTCSKFLCELLQKVLTNEITFLDAEKQLLLALETRKQVMEAANLISELKGYSLKQLLEEITPKPSTKILQYKELLVKLISLRVLLSKLVKKKP